MSLNAAREHASLQTLVNETFARLASEGLQRLNASELRDALEPAELCFVQKERQRAGEHSSAHRARCPPAKRSAADASCWILGESAKSCDFNAASPILPLSSRSTLVSRYRSLGEQGRAQRTIAPMLRRGVPLILIGDSMMRRIASALSCEVARVGAGAHHYYDFTELSAQGDLAPLRRRLAHLTQNASAGAVVLATIGLHYYPDDHLPDALKRLGSKRVASMLPLMRPSKLSHDASQLAGALQSVAAECLKCAVVVLTATMQHFASPAPYDGIFRSSLVLLDSKPETFDFRAYGFGCKPLADGAPGEASPNQWRASLVERAMRSTPGILLAPLHLLTRNWHDAHVGMTAKAFARNKRGVVNPVPDCTHYCYGPFLYEPVWWAMHSAWRSRMRAAAGATADERAL